MLYRLHNNILIIGLLSIGILAAMAAKKAFCLMSVGTIVAFVTQMALILFYTREKSVSYSGRSLFWVVLGYSIFIGIIFMLLSYYYEGDTFMFNKSDAQFYYKNSIKAAEIGFWENTKRLTTLFDAEDLGSLMFDSALMAIIPSKYFLNVVYVLTGALSAVLIFRIAILFMPAEYANLAGLTYGTSSFLIFFHCSFLKESIFVFLVICAMYFFYKAIVDGKLSSYLFTLLSLILILFFRPAITALLAIAFLIYLAISQRGKAISAFFYIAIAVLAPVVIIKIQDIMFNYTRGDMDAIIERGQAYDYSSSFSYFVSWFAAPFGPFPSLFPKEPGQPVTLNFYGAGLTYRLFLIFPMWMGIWYAIKERCTKMIPLYAFIIIGMLATGYILASLELRKVMTHIPFTYIFIFYGLYQWEKRECKPKIEPMIHFFTIGVLVLWTIIRG